MTQIRASSLSGECSWKFEANRGNFAFARQFPACVRRRAELSLSMNPLCKERAAEAVDAAWQQCYVDNAPFDHKP